MNINILFEFYKEDEDGYFESDGVKYNINNIFKNSEFLPIMYCNVNDLSWILKYDNPSIKGRSDIDYNIPILVSYTDTNKLLVVDGVHRLKKSIEENKKFIKVKFITNEVMNDSIIENKQ